MSGYLRLRTPMAEDIFLLFPSICFVHERCLTINKHSDLASSTLLMDLPSISILIWLFKRTCIRWLCQHNLRDSEIKLNLPKPGTNYLTRSYGYSGALLWDSLPVNLWKLDSLWRFKREIDRFYNNCQSGSHTGILWNSIALCHFCSMTVFSIDADFVLVRFFPEFVIFPVVLI